MNKLNIISLILTFAAFVLLTISFGTSWYHYQAKYYDRNYQVDFYYRATSYTYKKTILSNGEVRENENLRWNSKQSNEKGVYNACLAFAVLAWIVCLLSIVIHLLSIFSQSILDKVPFINYIKKFLMIPASIFCFLSFIILLDIGKAPSRDSRSNPVRPFIYHQDMVIYGRNFGDWYAGPLIGWIVVIIATPLSIGAAIINIFKSKINCGNDNNKSETPNP